MRQVEATEPGLVELSGRDGSLAVAILAGGQGGRIGGGKPFRMLHGTSLIERALESARAWSGDVVVVCREPAQVGGVEAPFLADAPGVEGPIAGLAAALRHSREAGHGLLLTIPCDSPFLPGDLADRLRSALTDSEAVVAESGGVWHPTCALWRTRTFDALGPYLATGRRSLRGFAEHVGVATCEWPAEPIDPFFNINSAEDLEAAERLLAS